MSARDNARVRRAVRTARPDGQATAPNCTPAALEKELVGGGESMTTTMKKLLLLTLLFVGQKSPYTDLFLFVRKLMPYLLIHSTHTIVQKLQKYH